MKLGAFRTTQWDPILLIVQIVCIQSSVYFSLGALIFTTSIVTGNSSYGPHQLFEYHEIHVTNMEGRLMICCFVLNAGLASLALWCIVRKAKLCLDFSCTFHLFHLVVCWWYNATFPTHMSWWFLNIITTAIMCIGGEFLCLKTELKEIPVGYATVNGKSEV